MTHNQYRAVALAKAIRRDAVDPEDLSETEWHLLLLAAGINRVLAAPLLVANRVMDNARDHEGYFAEMRRRLRRSSFSHILKVKIESSHSVVNRTIDAGIGSVPREP